MMIDHLSHTITKLGSSDNWAQFEVIILDKNKIYHKFNWQVEKYTEDGELMNCWLTTMVLWMPVWGMHHLCGKID